MSIRELRLASGISQKDLAKKLHIAPNSLSQYENGNRRIDSELAKRIADYFGVSLDTIYDYEPSSRPSSKGVKIPVLGDVRAGLPIEAVENIIDYEEISTEMARSGEYFALRVVGDSMEPRICEGDVVIVRKQPDLESGEVGIVLVNGDSATVKKVVKHEDGISLIAYNAASYPPHFYTKKEITTLPVTIIVKVVELRAKF